MRQLIDISHGLFVFVIALCCCSLPAVLGQVELKVSVIEAEGFCEWDTSLKEWVGFIPDIVKQMGAISKPPFKAKLKRVADGRYGRFEESTGTWNGLIGEVLNGTADMAAAPLTQTAGRELHIDFTHELLDVGLVTIARPVTAASPVSRSASFFLSVFDVGVWMSAVLVFFVTSLLLFLNARYNPREISASNRQLQQQQQQQQQVRPQLHEFSVGATVQDGSEFSALNSLLFTVSTGCFQGYKSMPYSLAGRCVCVFWWLFAAIFAATYVAGFLCGLVASRGSLSNRMATQDPRTQFGSNAAAFNSLVPVWFPGGSTEKMMKESKDPLFQLFYKLNANYRKTDQRLNGLNSTKAIVQLVKSDPKFFGIMESDMAMLMARRSNCELSVTGSLLNDKSYGFALHENSNWTRVMNHAILTLRETGVVRDLYFRHFGSSDMRCGSASRPAALEFAGEELARVFRDSLPIGLGTFAGPIFLYCCGLLLSLAAGLLDVYVFTRFERYQRASQQMHHAEETHDAGFGTLAFNDDREPVVSRLET